METSPLVCSSVKRIGEADGLARGLDLDGGEIGVNHSAASICHLEDGESIAGNFVGVTHQGHSDIWTAAAGRGEGDHEKRGRGQQQNDEQNEEEGPPKNV